MARFRLGSAPGFMQDEAIRDVLFPSLFEKPRYSIKQVTAKQFTRSLWYYSITLVLQSIFEVSIYWGWIFESNRFLCRFCQAKTYNIVRYSLCSRWPAKLFISLLLDSRKLEVNAAGPSQWLSRHQWWMSTKSSKGDCSLDVALPSHKALELLSLGCFVNFPHAVCLASLLLGAKFNAVYFKGEVCRRSFSGIGHGQATERLGKVRSG